MTTPMRKANILVRVMSLLFTCEALRGKPILQ